MNTATAIKTGNSRRAKQLFPTTVVLIAVALALGALLPSSTMAISFEELFIAVGESANDYLGSSVASAGDFNGDGYDDVIVGIPGDDTNGTDAGRACVFYGGPAADSVPDLILPGEDGGDEFGSAVSAAGDFNGDGFDDIVVGAALTDSGTVYVFFGGTDADAIPDVTYRGTATNDLFGFAVAGAGDIDGDGYDDLIVGAPGYDGGGAEAGGTFIFLGQASPDTAPADVTMTGEAAGDEFGYAVSAAGDFDGDGYCDLLVGAPQNDGGGTDAGRAYVFYGRLGFYGSTADRTANITFTGVAASDQFGVSVSGGGDFNGDGFGDVIIGAQLNDAGGTDAGRAYVFHGGFDADTTADLVLTGKNAGDRFGIVSCAGDVNGDGPADLIVGAPRNDTGGSDAGRVYLYFGGAAADTTADLIYTGEHWGDHFGSAVAPTGDMAGNRFGGIIVGAPYDDTGGYVAGSAVVFSIYPYRIISPNGGESWIAGERRTVRWLGTDSADLSCSFDGGSSWMTLASEVGALPDNSYSLIVPSTLTDYALIRVSYAGQPVTHANSDLSDAVFRIFEPADADEHPYHLLMSTKDYNPYINQPAYRFGHSIAGAGDINNDGYGDLIVGAPDDVLFYGVANLYLCGPTVDDVSDLRVNSPPSYPPGADGFSVAAAGDFNADGYEDFIVGGPFYPGSPYSGWATVFFGEADPDYPSKVVLEEGVTGDYFGYSVAPLGDVNEDGYDDIIVGAPKADGDGTARGRAYVYFGGPDFDTTADLVLTGSIDYGYFGCAVAGAGDVNGNGRNDVIVGARDCDDPESGSSAGMAYIFYGSTYMDANSDFEIAGTDSFSHFGATVAGAGDVNGDGYDDFVIGAPGDDGTDTEFGRVYLFYGGPDYNVWVNALPDLIFYGETPGDFFGEAISCADANGDGFADLLVGAGSNDAGAVDGGRSYLYLGGTLMDNEAELRITGDQPGAHFGSALALSDVNGDGSADIMIGAPDYDLANSEATGRIFLYELNSFHVLAPNGAETWHVGTTQTVTWLGDDLADIWLSADGGAYWELLEAGVGGEPTNSLSIFVPNRPTHYGLIKLALNGEPYFGADKSDTLFTINASIVTKAFTAEAAPEDGRGALISWETDPGPEDLAGYRLEKKFALPGTDEDWTEVIALTRQTSYHDEEATSGTRYRLNAINGLGFEYVLGEAAFGSTALLAAWPLPYRGGDLTVSFATTGGPGGGNGKAQVRLYDVAGRCVRTLVDGNYPPGYHMVTWDGRGEGGQRMASGVYFLRTKSGAHEETRKVVIVR